MNYELIHHVLSIGGTYSNISLGVDTYENCRKHFIQALNKFYSLSIEEACRDFDLAEFYDFKNSPFKIEESDKPAKSFLYTELATNKIDVAIENICEHYESFNGKGYVKLDTVLKEIEKLRKYLKGKK